MKRGGRGAASEATAPARGGASAPRGGSESQRGARGGSSESHRGGRGGASTERGGRGGSRGGRGGATAERGGKFSHSQAKSDVVYVPSLKRILKEKKMNKIKANLLLCDLYRERKALILGDKFGSIEVEDFYNALFPKENVFSTAYETEMAKIIEKYPIGTPLEVTLYFKDKTDPKKPEKVGRRTCFLSHVGQKSAAEVAPPTEALRVVGITMIDSKKKQILLAKNRHTRIGGSLKYVLAHFMKAYYQWQLYERTTDEVKPAEGEPKKEETPAEEGEIKKHEKTFLAPMKPENFPFVGEIEFSQLSDAELKVIAELTQNAENLKASVGHLNLKVDYYNRKDKKKEKLKLHDCNFQEMLDDEEMKKILQKLEEQAKIVIKSREKKNVEVKNEFWTIPYSVFSPAIHSGHIQQALRETVKLMSATSFKLDTLSGTIKFYENQLKKAALLAAQAGAVAPEAAAVEVEAQEKEAKKVFTENEANSDDEGEEEAEGEGEGEGEEENKQQAKTRYSENRMFYANYDYSFYKCKRVPQDKAKMLGKYYILDVNSEKINLPAPGTNLEWETIGWYPLDNSLAEKLPKDLMKPMMEKLDEIGIFGQNVATGNDEDREEKDEDTNKPKQSIKADKNAWDLLNEEEEEERSDEDDE